MSKDSTDGVSRRAFVTSVAALSVCPLVTACEFVEVFDTDIEGEASFDLTQPQFAALAQVGGKACISLGALDILLIRAAEDEVLAFERMCPHQQLDMSECDDNPLPGEWDQENQQLTCRWHGSVFGRNGDVVTQPTGGTSRAIRLFPVEFDPESGTGRVLSGAGGES